MLQIKKLVIALNDGQEIELTEFAVDNLRELDRRITRTIFDLRMKTSANKSHAEYDTAKDIGVNSHTTVGRNVNKLISKSQD